MQRASFTEERISNFYISYFNKQFAVVEVVNRNDGTRRVMQRFLEPRHEIPASAHASGHDEVIIRQLVAVAEAHSVGTWIEGGCGGLDVRDTSRQQWRQRAHAILSVGEGSAHYRPQRLVVQ